MDLLPLLSPEAADRRRRLFPAEAERSARLLQALGRRAGPPHEAVPLLELLLAALEEAPDPEMALLNLERWLSGLPTPASSLRLLAENPRLLADLVALFGSSQYLSDILARDPWLYSLLLEPDGPRTREDYAAALTHALRPLRKPESRREALRRVKRREFLRIGWRDLARRAPLEEIVREISGLADALVEAALEAAREEVAARFPTAAAQVRFSVIAMGKLGAEELNYSSDIDLVFVMDSPNPADEGHRRFAARLAETLIAVLAEDTPEGRCFRVDMRLRPEGRAGALARSFGAFRTYYDRWAETWERQALIKARAVAGDPELGRRFMELIEPVTYRHYPTLTLLEDVREMRAAVERKLEAAGELGEHVKEGRGSIRDVEFTVQLLQLLFGEQRPELRVRDTLTALERLRELGLLSPEEHGVFAGGYRFLREVEHRLQILQDRPVRRLPPDPAGRLRLARTMDFPDTETFMREFQHRAQGVRALALEIQGRLGVDGWHVDAFRSALLEAEAPESALLLRSALETRGFPAPDAALVALVRLAAGGPRAPHPAATRRLFAELAPALLDACAEAADPTEALVGIADLADRKVLHRAQYQTWLEHPEALQALCRFAGAAPAAMRTVLRFPELADFVTDEELLARRKSRAAVQAEAEARLAAAETYPRRLSTLRRLKLREYVRLAAVHAVDPRPVAAETEEWSDVAEALLRAALAAAVARLRQEGRWPREDAGDFAIFGLGRFGGRDLHFASDLDLVYVYRASDELGQSEYERLAQQLGEVLQAPSEEGPLFELDLRLRPEGRQGFTVTSLEAARRYYGEGGRAETWELQMLTRLRQVAGSEVVAADFRELVEARLYRPEMPAEWRDEIRAMKRRMETERVPEAARDRHLKLSPGGLADLEFTIQLLQLQHGGGDPSLRVPGTLEALGALQAAAHLSPGEAAGLREAHHFLTRARLSLSLLQRSGGADSLPLGAAEERLGTALARAVGLGDLASLERSYRTHTAAVRSVFERVFSAPEQP
ncbi:MAG: bifunctional [glutamate--ammonia ligase]-adenylyl-L-tyrosine phosphorylase/[glutamate--ammonia-ligase] adenylyltransferase [Armatimonadota bacterium]